MHDGFLGRIRHLFVAEQKHAPTPVRGGSYHQLPDLTAMKRAATDSGLSAQSGLSEQSDELGSLSLVGGCVQLLGLEQVKARLGTRWKSVADRAALIAEKVLGEHLEDADIYRPVGDLAFQICFKTNDEDKARLLVARISAAIEERIARELIEAEGAVSVDTFVARVPSGKIRGAKDPIYALYASLASIRDAVNTRAIKRRGIPALRYAGAMFQPLWSNHDSGTTKNRCVLDTTTVAITEKHLEEVEDPDEFVEAVAKIDCVIFAKSVERLSFALESSKEATIVIPVHFQTLAGKHPDFMDLALTLPPPYRKFVLLDLIGAPTAAPASELLLAVETGRSVTDRIILELSPWDHRIDQQIRAKIWGLSVSLGDLDSDDQKVVQDLARFALSSSEVGLYSFAYGANTLGKAVVAVNSGFDYIGGAAVHNTISAPRPRSRFTPLFGDHAARASGRDPHANGRSHPRFTPSNPKSIITFPDGPQQVCRILNVSASGAAILSTATAEVGSYLNIGSIGAQVVRITNGGFAVRFLEVQQPSNLEEALQAPVAVRKSPVI